MAQQTRQRVEQPVATTEIIGGREGARWINRRPDPEEFAEWFEQNVPIDAGMEHKDYLGGMTLIPGTEKVKYVKGMDAQQKAVIGEKEQLSYVPYPKVEARVSYFWNLMELRSQEWHGLIKPIGKPEVEDDTAIGRINRILPKGYWILPVPVGESYTYFICYTCAVRVYEKPIEYGWLEIVLPDGTKTRERIILNEPIREGEATKQVALLKRGWNNSPPYADDTALMRAETGAKGRALGMAGFLIVPGSSIATAEDMLEGFGGLVPATGEAQAQPEAQGKLPEIKTPQTGAEKAEQTREEMIAEARILLQELNDHFTDAYAEFTEWTKAKNPPIRNIGELDGPALRGCLKKLQVTVKEAREKRDATVAQDAAAETPDQPAEESSNVE